MMLMLYALMSLSFTGTALAQIFRWGPCPEVEPMKNFNPHMILGRWYESHRYFTATEFSATCVACDLRQGLNNTLIMNASALYTLMGRKISTGDIVIRSPYESYRSLLKFKVPRVGFPMPTYLILGTDYTTHMVGYSCSNMELMHFSMVWIFTREKEPSKAVFNKATKIIRKEKLNVKLLMKTDQRDCEEEPNEPEATQKPTSASGTTEKAASEGKTTVSPTSGEATTEATTVSAK